MIEPFISRGEAMPMFGSLSTTVVVVALSACSTPTVTNTTLALAATAIAGHSPSTQIQQVYYLGVFDPRDQLPPTIYRVRVRGQASVLASTRFASGWVRAELVDSLSGMIEIPASRGAASAADGSVVIRGTTIDRIDSSPFSNRRMVMFGPEGFREAPRDHRLVIAMGSSPEKFFAAVDEALGVVARVTQDSRSGPDIERALWQDMAYVREARLRTDLALTKARAQLATVGGAP